MAAGQDLLWVILLFLIGLGPRVANLTYHSLWLDEAVSIGWARLPARMIASAGLDLVQDKHPPLYYLLLHYWTHLFGEGETSVRLLSVVIGALAVPLGYMLMRELYGERAGVFAGILIAANPILVWYSQEVRMFALATTLLLGASWALVVAMQRFGGWHRWILYVLLATASFYTYLFSALVLVAHAVYVLLCWLRWRIVRQQKTPAIVIAFASLAVLCAPLAWQAWHVGTAEALPGQPFGNLPTQFNHALRAFLFWKAPWQGPLFTVVALIIGLMALWGAFVGLLRDRNRRGPSFVAAYLLVPWILANVLLWFDRTVFDEARYLLILAPAVCFALARPLGARQEHVRKLGMINALLVLVVFVSALGYAWTPGARREEWRGAASYLETHAGPDDAILVHADFAHTPFLYYYHGPATVAYPFTGAIESEAQITPLLSELAEHPAVWLVRSHWEVADPQGLIERWFDDRYPLITEQYPPGIVIKGYATGYQSAALPAGAESIDAVFAGSMRLVGYRLDGAQFRATDDLFHPPSGWIHVTLYWEVLNLLPEDVAGAVPFVRVTDEQGQLWGDRLERPAETLRMIPPTSWTPGEIVRSDYDVNLNPVAPPGTYRVEVGLTARGGQPVPVVWDGTETDRVVCGNIRIVE